MIQEYLFIDKTHKKQINEYKPDKVIIKCKDIDNSDCWILSYSVAKETEDSAKVLSDINEYIMDTFSPTILTNESSAYYNRRLFPCINEFERKLRKLLYLKSALNRGDEVAKNISELEFKDLGYIFKLMFTDDSFISSVKAEINKKAGHLQKMR